MKKKVTITIDEYSLWYAMRQLRSTWIDDKFQGKMDGKAYRAFEKACEAAGIRFSTEP